MDTVLVALRRVWIQHPDMRFGQLIVNLLDPNPNAIFNVEDETLLMKLDELEATGRWPTASLGRPGAS